MVVDHFPLIVIFNHLFYRKKIKYNWEKQNFFRRDSFLIIRITHCICVPLRVFVYVNVEVFFNA